MHRQENLNSLISFPRRDVPFHDNSKCFRVRDELPGLVRVTKGKKNLVITDSSGNIDSIVESGGRVKIGRMAVENGEKSRALGPRFQRRLRIVWTRSGVQLVGVRR